MVLEPRPVPAVLRLVLLRTIRYVCSMLLLVGFQGCASRHFVILVKVVTEPLPFSFVVAQLYMPRLAVDAVS